MTNVPRNPHPHSHFQSGGADYKRFRPSYPTALIQALAERCVATNLALDVGCGSGQLSVLLPAHFTQVVATDVSESQLRSAESHSRLHYCCEAAEAMSLKSAQADLIVSAQAAHWFDLDGFYREVARVGKPGSVVALISYGVPYIESPINNYFQRFYWQALAPFWSPERYHVETGYMELAFPFQRLDMPRFFIRRRWTMAEFMGYLNTWSGVKTMLAQGQGKLLTAFEHQLQGHWQDSDARQQVVWPIALRVGRIN